MSSPPAEVSRSLITGYFGDLWSATLHGWDRFWFTPGDPIVLGIIRICTGLMLVYTHVVYGLDLATFLGENSILPPALVRAAQPASWPSFWWLIPTEWVVPVHWGCVAILVLFTLGVLTRLTAILSLVIAISYANRLFFAAFGLDQITTMLAFYLAIGPSGDALSIDQWRRGKRLEEQGLAASRWCAAPSVGTNLALRLIQVHMGVIYFYAGASKLSGFEWWDGSAMWLAFASYEYQSRDMTWLAWHPWIVNFLSHITVLWELTFAALVWIPLLRPLVVLIAIPLHVGIGMCLGMWTFGLIMLVGCTSFVSPELVHRLFRGKLRPAAVEQS